MAAGRRYGHQADACTEARITGAGVVHVAADFAVTVLYPHFAGKDIEHVQRLWLARPAFLRSRHQHLLARARQHVRRARTMRGGLIGGATDQQVIAPRFHRCGLQRPRRRQPRQQYDQHRSRSVLPLPAAHATSCCCLRPRPLRVAPGRHYRSRTYAARVDQSRRHAVQPAPGGPFTATSRTGRRSARVSRSSGCGRSMA